MCALREQEGLPAVPLYTPASFNTCPVYDRFVFAISVGGPSLATDRYLLWDMVERRCLRDLLLCPVPNSYYNCTRLFAIQWLSRHQIVSQLD